MSQEIDKYKVDKYSMCPACDKRLDAAQSIGKNNIRPSVGDVSMCWHCGEFLEYSKNMKLVKLNLLDVEKVDRALIKTLYKMRAARDKANESNS